MTRLATSIRNMAIPSLAAWGALSAKSAVRAARATPFRRSVTASAAAFADSSSAVTVGGKHDQYVRCDGHGRGTVDCPPRTLTADAYSSTCINALQVHRHSLVDTGTTCIFVFSLPLFHSRTHPQKTLPLHASPCLGRRQRGGDFVPSRPPPGVHIYTTPR